jgi:hypothetical protein
MKHPFMNKNHDNGMWIEPLSRLAAKERKELKENLLVKAVRHLNQRKGCFCVPCVLSRQMIFGIDPRAIQPFRPAASPVRC